METDFDRHGVHGSADYTSVEIPEEIRKKLDALPDIDGRGVLKLWKPWEDKIILEYYDKKSKEKIGEILGVSNKLVVKRYKELTGERRLDVSK